MKPTVIRISVPIERLVAGDRVSREWGIAAAGGRVTRHWIIRGDAGEDVEIVAGSEKIVVRLP